MLDIGRHDGVDIGRGEGCRRRLWSVRVLSDSWTGSGGNGAWTTAGNWSAGVPISTSVVCIGDQSGGPFTVSLAAGGGTAVAALVLGGTSAATLTLTGDLLLRTGASEVTSNGTLVLDSSINNSTLSPESGVTVTIDTGGKINTGGPLIASLGGTGATIINDGTINASALNNDLINAVSVINNGTINVATGDTLGVGVDAESAVLFTNAGGTVANDGTFFVDGTFMARGGTETGSPITIETGATLDDDTTAGAGSFTTVGGGTAPLILTGTGPHPGVSASQTLTARPAGGVEVAVNFEVDGTINIDATTNGWLNTSSGVTLTIASSGKINTSGTTGRAFLGNSGGTIVNNGTINPGAAVTDFANGVIVTNNGTITVPIDSKVTNDGTLTQGQTGVLAVINPGGAPTPITGGTYVLGGTLDVTTKGTPTGPFTPISSAKAISGQFDNLSYHGTNYTTSYSSSAVTLTPAAGITITTSLSGGGQSGASISVPIGTAVTDEATLSGATSTAGGTVTYSVYSDSACTASAASAGTVDVTDGSVPSSNSFSTSTAGTYYWRASYSGDATNKPAD